MTIPTSASEFRSFDSYQEVAIELPPPINDVQESSERPLSCGRIIAKSSIVLAAAAIVATEVAGLVFSQEFYLQATDQAVAPLSKATTWAISTFGLGPSYVIIGTCVAAYAIFRRI